MEELIKKLLANDLEELRGLRINGQVPVHPDLINQVIAQLLEPEQGEAPTGPARQGGTSNAGSGASKGVNPVALARRYLNNLEVRVEDGRIIVDFDVRVP